MTKSTGKGPSADSLRDELRQAGLRATAARVTVLRRLHSAHRAITHAEFANELAPDGLDRATVFRVLVDLARSGIAKRMDEGDHRWRYSLKQRHDDANGRAFFVCDVSGEKTALPAATVVVTPGRAAPRALKAGEYVVHIRGVGDRFRDRR